VVWRSGRKTKDWQCKVIIPIHKKGNLTTGPPLSLASLEKCMPSALKKDAAKQLNQSWMIPSSVFVVAVALQTKCSLSSKYKKSWECAKDVYACFVDLKKAYDRVPRENLWEMLREYAVDGRLLLAVKSLYSCSEVCVRVGAVESQPVVLDSDKGVCCHHSS